MTRTSDHPRVRVGGVKTARLSRKDLLAQMVADCANARIDARHIPKLVFTANGQTVALAATDRSFREALDEADIVHADGQPIVLASRWLTGTPIPERSATTDFIHDAAQAAEDHGLRFYLLGGTEEVNARCAEILQRRYPRLAIAGRRNGYFARSDERAICDEIERSGIRFQLGFQRRFAQLLDVAPERLELDHVGLNHLTWERAAHVDGVDRLPELLAEHGEAIADQVHLPLEMMRRLGVVPSYYLRYFYAHDEVTREQQSNPSRASAVADIERRLLEMYADPALDEKPELLGQRGGAWYSEAAVQLAAYRLAWAQLNGIDDTDLHRVRAAFHYVRSGETVAPADLLDADALRALVTGGDGPAN